MSYYQPHNNGNDARVLAGLLIAGIFVGISSRNYALLAVVGITAIIAVVAYIFNE